jgi:hypothetical protein
MECEGVTNDDWVLFLDAPQPDGSVSLPRRGWGTTGDG